MGARWSEAKERILSELWLTHTAPQIAAALGMSHLPNGGARAVNAKAARMKLPAKRDAGAHVVAHVAKSEPKVAKIEWHERRPIVTEPYRPGVDEKPDWLSANKGRV